MKSKLLISLISSIMMLLISCKRDAITSYDVNIVFLHHSTGHTIWNGKPPSLIYKVVNKMNKKVAEQIRRKGLLPSLIEKYNEENNKKYGITELVFPKAYPYGWNNFPYDYYNIWIKNEGKEPFQEEPTLEILNNDYQVVVFKHCFPVCYIQPEQDSADINSDIKTLANYKLQYSALRDKLHEFPDIKFILFIGPAQVKTTISEEMAQRARVFFEWVRNEWDINGDNIYLWDLYALQTEGGLYLKDEYAVSQIDSHPNKTFSSKASVLLFNRIIDVLETDGKKTRLNGEKINF